MTQFNQLLKTNNTEILSSSIVDKQRFKQAGSIFQINSWIELINPVFKRICVHGAQSLANRWNNQCLFANYPSDSCHLMFVLNKNVFMHHVKVRLDVLEIWFAYAFHQDNGYLLTCEQIVWTYYLHYFCCDGLISIMNQLFDEIEVN